MGTLLKHDIIDSGLLGGASAVVIGADAPAEIIQAAGVLKKVMGDLIQICDGIADNIQIELAQDTVEATGVRGAVQLVGSFNTTAQLTGRKNVDVHGPTTITCTSNSNIHALKFDGSSTAISNAVWRDIEIIRTGTTTGARINAVWFYGDIEPSVKMLNCTITATMATTGSDMFVSAIFMGAGVPGSYYTTEPTIDNCTLSASNSSTGGVHALCNYVGKGSPDISNTTVTASAPGGGSGNAVYLTEWTGKVRYTNITGYGYKNGFRMDGGIVCANGCNFYCGAGAGGNDAGIMLGNAGAGTINNCNGYSADVAYTHGMTVAENNDVVVNGGYYGPKMNDVLQYWDLTADTTQADGNNGRIGPNDTSFAWCLYRQINVYTSASNPGITLNVGTTPGNNDIVSGADISGGAGAQFALPILANATIAAGGYLYLTMSGAYTGTFVLGFTAVHDYNSCRGVLIAAGPDYGKTRIRGAHTVSAYQANSVSVYFNNTPATTGIMFENCYIEALGVAAAAYADNAFSTCPFKFCTLKCSGDSFTTYATYLPFDPSNEYVGYVYPGQVISYSQSVVDDGSITLETGRAGYGTVIFGDNAERSDFYFTSAGVVTLGANASANVVNTDTDTKYCIIDAGAGPAIKNRSGGTLTVTATVTYQ